MGLIQSRSQKSYQRSLNSLTKRALFAIDDAADEGKLQTRAFSMRLVAPSMLAPLRRNLESMGYRIEDTLVEASDSDDHAPAWVIHWDPDRE